MSDWAGYEFPYWLKRRLAPTRPRLRAGDRPSSPWPNTGSNGHATSLAELAGAPSPDDSGFRSAPGASRALTRRLAIERVRPWTRRVPTRRRQLSGNGAPLAARRSRPRLHWPARAAGRLNWRSPGSPATPSSPAPDGVDVAVFGPLQCDGHERIDVGLGDQLAGHASRVGRTSAHRQAFRKSRSNLTQRFGAPAPRRTSAQDSGSSFCVRLPRLRSAVADAKRQRPRRVKPMLITVERTSAAPAMMTTQPGKPMTRKPAASQNPSSLYESSATRQRHLLAAPLHVSRLGQFPHQWHLSPPTKSLQTPGSAANRATGYAEIRALVDL